MIFMKRQWILGKSKQLLGMILGLLLTMAAHAQAPNWQLAVGLHSTPGDDCIVKATATDAAGNVYLTGVFSGTASFGRLRLTSAAPYDMFVVKWSPATNDFEWAQQCGGADSDDARAIAVNGSSVYIAGYVGGTGSLSASFGGIVVNVANYGSAFVAKLADNGTSSSFVWAKATDGMGTADANGIAVQNTSVYVTGSFSDVAQFDNLFLTCAGSINNRDVYVAKLADAGASARFVWAQRAGGDESETTSAVAVQGNNVYVGGWFASAPADFGNSNLNAVGNHDGFVAKLIDAGSSSSFAWAKQMGGVSRDQVNALAVRGANVYAAGYYGGATAAFGPIVLANVGSSDLFVARLTDAGATSSIAWAAGGGGAGTDEARAVAVSGANVYVGGLFSGSAVTFGPFVVAASATQNKLLLAKLVDTGAATTYSWVQQVAGQSSEIASALAVYGTRVYATGLISVGTQFGSFAPLPVGSFLAAISDQTLATALSVVGANGVAAYPNPAHATVAVSVPAAGSLTTATLTLTDALGRVVRTQSLRLATAADLDLTGLAPGLYQVRVQAGGQQWSQRLVVE